MPANLFAEAYSRHCHLSLIFKILAIVSTTAVGLPANGGQNSDDNELVVYQPDNPPWGSGKTKDGFIVSIVRATFEHAHIPYREVFVPWKRGQRQVEVGKNGFLAPITRLEHREHKYQWIAPLNISKLHLVTSSPTLAKSKWHILLDIPVVARMESPSEFLLQDLGFKSITVVENEGRAAKMILANRVVLWMQRGLPGNWAYHKAMGQVENLTEIQSWDTPLQYLIASKGVPASTVAKLRRALNHLRDSGKIDKIKGSFFSFPISCDLLFTCPNTTPEIGIPVPVAIAEQNR